MALASPPVVNWWCTRPRPPVTSGTGAVSRTLPFRVMFDEPLTDDQAAELSRQVHYVDEDILRYEVLRGADGAVGIAYDLAAPPRATAVADALRDFVQARVRQVG